MIALNTDNPSSAIAIHGMSAFVRAVQAAKP
jgi:hypothetical protein